MSNPITDPATSTAGAGDTPGAGTGSGTSAATTTPEGRTFSQEEVNRLLAEERRKADEKRKADEARAKAQAAEEAAKRSGEWERLAQAREQRAAQAEQERDGYAARYQALAETLEREIKARSKALPEELRDLIPGGDDLAARHAALLKLEAAAAKLTARRTPGTPAGPRGIGGVQPATGASDDDLIAQKRARIGAL